MPLTLYVREGCHLCDEFLLGLSLDLGTRHAELGIVDVDGSPELAARFGLRVPVLQHGGAVVCEGRYDRDRVRRALRL
jgi:Glutaredoxin-like domain (DUF836)